MGNVQIRDYLNTHEQLVQALEDLTEEQLKWKAGPASWSVTEVLAHLADHSIVVSFRIRDILAGTEVQLPVFNQDAWVSGQYANSGNAADSLEVVPQPASLQQPTPRTAQPGRLGEKRL